MRFSLPLLLFGALAASAAEPAGKPNVIVILANIVFILADDLGLDGVSRFGADKRRTPNIDVLAASGVRFETCHSAPLCGPSRCALMTGRYAFRTGGLENQSWRNNGPGAKSKDEQPMAKLLKQAGYATCESGKWRQVGETPRTGDSTNTAPTRRRGAGIGRTATRGTARESPRLKSTTTPIRPVLHYRAGVVDIPRQTEDVAADVRMARDWKRGTIDEAAIKRPGTESGFRKSRHARGPKPILLGQSRGGLMTLAWAVRNPDSVQAWAGIHAGVLRPVATESICRPQRPDPPRMKDLKPRKRGEPQHGD